MTRTPTNGRDVGTGRSAAWRARAEATARHYQQAAQTRPLLGLPLSFAARYVARQGVLLASATAFRLFLWLLPLALLIGGVLAGATRSDGGTARAATKSAGVTGTASREIVKAITDGHRSWVQAVLVGAVLFLWASWTLIRSLTAINAHAWQVPIPRRHLRSSLITTVTFAGSLIVIVIGVGAVAHLHAAAIHILLLAFLAQVAAVSAVWLMVCLRLPDRRSRWTDLIPGSILVGVGLSVLNVVAQVYIPLKLKHASELYGSLGIAGVMLAWLLIIGQVLVGAAFVNGVWADYRHPEPASLAGNASV